MIRLNAGRFPPLRSFVILAFVALVAISFPAWLNRPGDQAKQIAIYLESDGLAAEAPLPIALFRRTTETAQSISGYFSITVAPDAPQAFIYVPYVVGRLVLSNDRGAFYESSPIQPARTLTKVNNALVAVPVAMPPDGSLLAQDIAIAFHLQPDRSGLAILSEIYVGAERDFDRPVLLNYLYYEVFRNGLLGVQFFLVLIAAALFFQEKHRKEISAPLVILCYFISIGLSGILSAARPGIDFSDLVVSSTLIVGLALLIYGYSVCYGVVKRYHLQLLGVTAFVWLAVVLVMTYSNLSLRVINIFIAGPSLSLALLGLILMCIAGLRRSRSDEIELLLVGALALFAATLHDVSFRIGLHPNGIVMSPLGSTMFIAILSYSSILKYFSTQNALLLANVRLKTSLEIQSGKLREEFAKTSKLLSAAAAQEETSRMTRELHDGVLTYLALINIMSESQDRTTIDKMGHLSRLATNEIRIILDTRLNEEASLAIALSSLRQNIVEPLGLRGIRVEWSTIALLDYGPVAPKLLMNVVRIIQEAIHNAVVRGKCSTLRITAQEVAGVYAITVDNFGGKNFSDRKSIGLGIQNMKERASQIGGSVEIIPKDTGASLILILPPPKI